MTSSRTRGTISRDTTRSGTRDQGCAAVHARRRPSHGSGEHGSAGRMLRICSPHGLHAELGADKPKRAAVEAFDDRAGALRVPVNDLHLGATEEHPPSTRGAQSRSSLFAARAAWCFGIFCEQLWWSSVGSGNYCAWGGTFIQALVFLPRGDVFLRGSRSMPSNVRGARHCAWDHLFGILTGRTADIESSQIGEELTIRWADLPRSFGTATGCGRVFALLASYAIPERHRGHHVRSTSESSGLRS